MSKKSTKLTPLPSDKKKKPFVERVSSWIDNQVLPYISIGIMVLATAYTAVVFVGKLSVLPEQAQGAIALVAVAFVTSKAVKKLKK